jgi:hypothetical protein
LANAQGKPSDKGWAVFDIRDSGAAGDGTTMNTRAIQAAIDTCTAAGGGTVLVPKGTYLTGTIVLKDYVTLYLAPQATLLGSKSLDDYPPKERGSRGGTGGTRALVYAHGARNVAIAGRGTIDGQGAAFDRGKPRPLEVCLVECKGVAVSDVTLKNAAVLVLLCVACDDVNVRGVTVNSFANYNNDGIDMESCHNVVISDCNVACSDDAICLKSGMLRSCKNVVVTNCVLSTYCGAIKLGTESQGGFENISISNCSIYDTWMCGIKLLLVDGGKLDNVTISNITMDNVAGPIFIRLGDRGRPYGESAGLPTGSLRNVLISNIRARVAKTVPKSLREPNVQITVPEKVACCISGIPGHCIENLAFANIHITFPGGGTSEDARRKAIPEQEKEYPEYRMFGTLPAYAFYVRHARGLSFSNIRVDLDGDEYRPALVCEDVQDLDISGLRAAVPVGGGPLVRLRQTQEALISGCRPLGDVATFVQVEGEGSSGISLVANDFRRVKTAFETVEGATKTAIRVSANSGQ